ncbi:MAG: hypothetical protein ACRDD7_06785 [Peptostreptococcaceae bacterium]
MTRFKINENTLILEKLSESKEEMNKLFYMITEHYCSEYEEYDEEDSEYYESSYTNEEADEIEGKLFWFIHQVVQSFICFGFSEFERQEEREIIIRIVKDIQWRLNKIINNSYDLEERYIVYNEIESRLRDIYEYVGLITERIAIRF